MSDYNDVYYSPFKSSRNGKITVVCWQWFDLFDYDIENFFVEGDDDKIKFAECDKHDEYSLLKFPNESEAVDWIREHIKSELVDDEYAFKYSNVDDYLK